MSGLVPKHLRRFPHVAAHNWLIHHYLACFLEEAARRYANGILLDIGCGVKPWQSLFEGHVTQYLGIDLADCVHGAQDADFVGSAYETGMPDSHADTVLCTEVLEHLEEPQRAILEMNRVLAPGGTVILTVPLFWHLHEAPRDYYRYTSFGLRHLFEQGGFEVIEIRPLTGFVVTFGQLLAYFNRGLARGRLLRGAISLVNWNIQHVSRLLDRFDGSQEFTCLYGLIARKEAGTAQDADRP